MRLVLISNGGQETFLPSNNIIPSIGCEIIYQGKIYKVALVTFDYDKEKILIFTEPEKSKRIRTLR